MALTDLIEQELLATLDGEADPQAVLDRYAGSKGPLYAALARATPQATARFQEIRENLKSLTAKRKAEAERAAAEEERATNAERRANEAEKRLKHATDALRAETKTGWNLASSKRRRGSSSRRAEKDKPAKAADRRCKLGGWTWERVRASLLWHLRPASSAGRRSAGSSRRVAFRPRPCSAR